MRISIKIAFVVLASAAVSTLCPLAQAGNSVHHNYVTFDNVAVNPQYFSGKRIAIYGRISMRLEDTQVDNTCSGATKSGTTIATNIDLKLYDEVTEYTEKQANQYRNNLERYSAFHNKCAWVVGIFSPSESVTTHSTKIATLKQITYIGRNPL